LKFSLATEAGETQSKNDERRHAELKAKIFLPFIPRGGVHRCGASPLCLRGSFEMGSPE
jgi:hypothetical protein